MLVLTRRPGETIRIGDDITISVLGIKGNQVRIGIEAPRTVAVHREEIYERIRLEGLKTSAKTSVGKGRDEVSASAAQSA